MPLYYLKHPELGARLIYAKTPAGAKKHYLSGIAGAVTLEKPTPIEAAILSKDIPVETVGKGADVVMENDPPEARRGWAPPEDSVIGDITGSAEAAPHFSDEAVITNERIAGDPEDDGFITTHGLDNATPRGDIATSEEDDDVIGDDHSTG